MTEDSFSAPASAPSINKIPFLVFDAILVITAVTLALTAGGPLSPLLFFWILVCVIVGGVVACLPFWIEFRDRMRLSEYEIRERQNSSHDSQWQYVDARLVELNEFLQKLHLRLGENAERLAALEARPPAPTADEVAILCSNSLQSQWPQWQEGLLGVLSKRTDILFNEQNVQNAKLSASQESRIAELSKEFASVEAALRNLDARLAEIALLSAANAAAAVAHSNASTAAARDAFATNERDNSVTDEAHHNRATDEEPSFLNDDDFADDDAFAEEDEALEAEFAEDEAFEDESLSEEEELEAQFATEEATPEEETAEDEFAEEDEFTADDFAEDEVTAQAEASAESEVVEIQAKEDTTKEDNFAAQDTVATNAETTAFAAGDEAEGTANTLDPAATATEDTSASVATTNTAVAAEEPATASAPEALTATPAADQSVAEAPAVPAIAPQQPALLETPEPPARPKKATSNDKTTLVAQVLIGIGNKPYVRGIGPGLSMDKGVPMQFVEIGKWEWVCPNGTEPIIVLIYKNDEVPSSLGEIELEAGQRRAVTPTFAR